MFNSMPIGGPGETPGPTVTVWMGEDVERFKRCIYHL
ncbi:hypothetical protein N783_12325 [Pontibacillus marinus BH030004 = DSM 16465]|uniref:Uncharacterized protein n=1 Tax=Pontibacillus marinus BH030004 = DSM 16465 TaxID=1385511 RepID=A0A0A5G563_9BACI|nr:hypothetical protein N783_12325 [Pontibacillus marinus BH030004 = DSM 16465]